MKYFVISNNKFSSVITAKNRNEAYENNNDFTNRLSEEEGGCLILTEKEAKKMAREIIAWKV